MDIDISTTWNIVLFPDYILPAVISCYSLLWQYFNHLMHADTINSLVRSPNRPHSQRTLIEIGRDLRMMAGLRRLVYPDLRRDPRPELQGLTPNDGRFLRAGNYGWRNNCTATGQYLTSKVEQSGRAPPRLNKSVFFKHWKQRGVIGGCPDYKHSLTSSSLNAGPISDVTGPTLNQPSRLKTLN